MKPAAPNLFILWPLTEKQCLGLLVTFQMSLSCQQFRQRDISPLTFSHGVISITVSGSNRKIIQYFTKEQIYKMSSYVNLCNRTLFFFSSPINRRSAHQIYLVSLWRGPTRWLGTTALSYLTVYKAVKTTSTLPNTTIECNFHIAASVLTI